MYAIRVISSAYLMQSASVRGVLEAHPSRSAEQQARSPSALVILPLRNRRGSDVEANPRHQSKTEPAASSAQALVTLTETHCYAQKEENSSAVRTDEQKNNCEHATHKDSSADECDTLPARQLLHAKLSVSVEIYRSKLSTPLAGRYRSPLSGETRR